METKIPRQTRSREPRVDHLRSSASVAEIPPMHFRIHGGMAAAGSLAPPVAAPSCSTQSSPFTFARASVYFVQVARTALALLVADGLSVLTCLAVTQLLTSLALEPVGQPQMPLQLWGQAAAFLVTYLLLGLYPGIGLNPIVELKSLVLGNLAAAGLLGAFHFANGSWGMPQMLSIGLLAVMASILNPLMRLGTRSFLARCSWWGQPALVIGSAESASAMMDLLNMKTASGLRPFGIIDHKARSHAAAGPRQEILGTLADVATIAKEHHIFWALVMPELLREENAQTLIQYCRGIPNIILIPHMEGFPSLWSTMREFGGVMGLHYRERLLVPWADVCKRTFDLVAVLVGTLIFSPFLISLLLLTWISTRIYSPGPIFYSQERVGRNGKQFRAWKFRTMVVNAESALAACLREHPELQNEWNATQKLRNDPRIIPGVGNFLRITSLDELPQLWNVLRGEMSLVGPRPFILEQLKIYGDHHYELYRKVRPGLTGLWQISGRNHTTFQERAQFDAYYVKNWSMWLDIFILVRTVKTVLFREGAF